MSDFDIDLEADFDPFRLLHVNRNLIVCTGPECLNALCMKKPTMQDVADLAGVSKATVSRFLHQHPNLKPETRERIDEAVQELNYRSDPMVSEFLRQVRAGHVVGSGTVLGWLNTHGEEGYWQGDLVHPLLKGAQLQCEELGLGLETFWAGDPRMSPSRLNTILNARGIRGLILPPGSRAVQRLKGFPWHDFAVVEVNPPPEEPTPWHCIGTDAHQNMRLMLEELCRAGYRRIGLVLARDFSARDGHGMLAEALLQQFLNDDGTLCRPWVYGGEWMGNAELPSFFDWFEQETPDVLLCLHTGLRDLMREKGIAIPQELGLAHVCLAEDVPDWSGLNRHSEEKGRASVEVLVTQLSRNEIGPPADSRQLLIPGEWVQGTTTRPAS